MLKALIFDVDGTLAETEEAHRQAFNETFADMGIGWSWDKELYRELLKTTGGKERMAAYQILLGTAELSTREIAKIHVQKTAKYAELLAQGKLELRLGVADTIQKARDAGLKIAIATTTNTPNVEALCQCCWSKPATEVFDHIAAGDMVLNKKPAPDVFLLALEQLGLNADDCIAFEDSRNGVLSAKGAGLRVLTTPSWYTANDDFSDAEWVFDSLQDTGAQGVLFK
ncbi:MAG: HAD-IA family hydrolase [Amylibacter sp.]|nr:HAD-IA family hydrolase [Amylibacter sp.]